MAQPWAPLIAQLAQKYGVDPRAALAVSSVEGLSGRVGDGGHAFGPFQLNDAGGVLTGRPGDHRSFAESPAGINWAMQRIAGVSKGLTGQAAVNAIVRRFERPQDPNGEVASALAAYGKVPASGGGSAASSPVLAQGGGSPGGASMRDALLQMAMQNNSAIMAGQTPDIQGALSLLSTLRGGGMSSGGSSLPTAPGANGALVSGAGGSVVQAAKGMLGTPYVWGGTQPGKALDCSGFLQQAYAKAGIKIPRTTYDQVKVGQNVNLKNLQPGDAVFTEPGKNGPNHVGMYVGNGMIQESPHTGDHNKLIPLKDFLGGGFVAARRYVK